MKRCPSDDHPGSGTHDRFAADRAAVLDPHTASGTGMQRLTAGRHCVHMGTGDERPPVQRPGAHRADTMPSRVGDTLRWPDGRVTGLDAKA